MAKFCKYCGTEIKGDTNFCDNCGANLKEEAPATAPVPKNTNPNDNFFDNLYSEFKIDRINANRFINSKGNKRGPITEILVYNF